MLRTPLHTPLALTVAPCLALVLASAAGAAQASTRDGAWRLAAQAPSAPRGVPGGSLPRASTAGLPGGSRGALPQVNTVTQPTPPVTASAFPLEPAGTPP